MSALLATPAAKRLFCKGHHVYLPDVRVFPYSIRASQYRK
jgi:hypothetical protein